MKTIIGIVGNPRPQSRTHEIARILTREIGRVSGATLDREVDLAVMSDRLFDRNMGGIDSEVERVVAADIIVVASPTYKATFSGLTKAFLDRVPTGALGRSVAVPILLGGSPDHRLAVDVHFTPLLLELGASVPVRGLFVLESDYETFGEFARVWADDYASILRR